jgi:hypothetical protein
MESTKKEMNPVIAAAALSLEKVAGVASVMVVNDLMYKKDNKYGADIVIDDELTGLYNAFLDVETAKSIVAYPNGIFVAQEFVYHVLNPKHLDELFEDPEDDYVFGKDSTEELMKGHPDYEFDILKNIDEDGNMHFPPHTGNTETVIDVLPGADDLKKKKK